MAELMIARVRLPLFSIKHPEAFQVMSSLPVPQPSSLVGLLAYCLGVATGLGTRALDRVRDWVRGERLLAARAAPAEEGLPLAPSSVVLRRFRVVDEGRVRKEKREALTSAIEREDFKALKSVLDMKLMDALYREYVMGHELLCAWAVGSDIDIKPNWLYLAQRIGDTESLCTVVDVRAYEAEVYEAEEVRTKFPTPMEYLTGPVEGPHTVAKMCDELRIPRPYVIPCEVKMEKRKDGLVIPIIKPSEVKIVYERPIRVIEAEDFTLTAFWPVEKTGRRRRK